jgi:hypothetical protein
MASAHPSLLRGLPFSTEQVQEPLALPLVHRRLAPVDARRLLNLECPPQVEVARAEIVNNRN